MVKYKTVVLKSLNDSQVDQIYKDLLKEKWQFIIIIVDDEKYVLTKEKSLFKITDENEFIKLANEDIYYHTEFVDDDNMDLGSSLEIFKKYIAKYEDRIVSTLYGDKYIFGSVAVRIDEDSFITTIRGKEDLSEYTIVRRVDHDSHTIYVKGKKATLNAPLLAHLFDNKDVNVIVHINHYFDSKLKNDEYAFPGTVRDSMRDNKESFNIKYHGVVYLFDKDGKRM